MNYKKSAYVENAEKIKIFWDAVTKQSIEDIAIKLCWDSISADQQKEFFEQAASLYKEKMQK